MTDGGSAHCLLLHLAWEEAPWPTCLPCIKLRRSSRYTRSVCIPPGNHVCTVVMATLMACSASSGLSCAAVQLYLPWTCCTVWLLAAAEQQQQTHLSRLQTGMCQGFTTDRRACTSVLYSNKAQLMHAQAGSRHAFGTSMMSCEGCLLLAVQPELRTTATLYCFSNADQTACMPHYAATK